MSKTVRFQSIQFSIGMQFKLKYILIVKNIPISSYSVSVNNSNLNNSVQYMFAVGSIQPIDMVLSDATILGQSGSGSTGN